MTIMGAASHPAVDVSSLSERNPTASVSVQVDPMHLIEPPLQVRWTSPLTVRATIQHSGKRFLVTGRVSGEAERLCSRCLTSFTWSIDVPFTAEYRRVALPETAEEGGVSVGPEGEFLMEGDRLDLLPVISEALVLAAPIQAYCRPDCAGLCPVCGKNLNEGTCSCEGEDVDPRLASLARWLERPRNGRLAADEGRQG